MRPSENENATEVPRKTRRPMPPVRVYALKIAVAMRRQTPEEQRQFGAAVKIFLSEIVRQHMRQINHEQRPE